MGKGSSSAPPTPDPNQVASAQAQANVDAILASAAVNRYNQVTPYGSVTWTPTGLNASGQPTSSTRATTQGATTSPPPAGPALWAKNEPFAAWMNGGGQDPGATYAYGASSSTSDADRFDPNSIEQWMQTITLSPEEQAKLRQQQQIALSLGGLAQNRIGQIPTDKFTLYGMPAGVDSLGDGNYDATRQRVEEALYGRSAAYLDPQYQAEERALETKLANQGIPLGSRAYSQAMTDYRRSRDDAYARARADAIAAGGAEDSRLFGQNLTSAQFMNDARARAIQEALLERSQPMNELAALLQGAPALNVPQPAGQPSYQVAPPDVSGNIWGAYNAQASAANAAQNRQSQTLGNLLNAGGSIASGFLISSRAVKDDHGDIDEAAALSAIGGLPLRAWSYKADGEVHIGPYAEDWLAATGLGDGRTIHIADALGTLLAANKALLRRVEDLEAQLGKRT